MAMKHLSMLLATALIIVPACASDAGNKLPHDEISKTRNGDQLDKTEPIKSSQMCPTVLSAGGYINAMPGPGYDPKNRPAYLNVRLANADGWAGSVKQNSADSPIEVSLFRAFSNIVKPPARKPRPYGSTGDKFELRFKIRQPESLQVIVTCHGEQIGSGSIGLAR